MEFEEYLKKKKIDPIQFRSKEQTKYESLKVYFDAAGFQSFDHAKKFLINPIRRQFPLQNEQ